VRRKDVDLDTKEGREMAMLDNLTTQVNLAWDETEIESISDQVEGFDVGDFGFEIDDLPQVVMPTDKQGDGEGEPQTEVKEDDFDPDAHYETKVKAGEVWQLGEHRLMCGDSTDADAVAKLMNGERADIAFTSPPYNAGSINQADNPRTHAKYGEYDDNKTSAEYLDFIKTNVGLLLDNADEVFYNIGLVSGNKKEIFQLINIYLDKFKDMLYWRKSNCAPCIQPGVINNLVEFIIAFGNNGTRRFKNPQFSQGSYYNVIEGKNASDNEYSKIHKATFPVYLPAEFIKSFTPENGSVLDCFGGTGTTMIAAEQLGRKCFMMELDPHYCTVIIARWEKLTGGKAVKLNQNAKP
jgi:DNA modification methylase